MLIIGSAPIQNVISVTRWLCASERPERPVLLIRESAASHAAGELPECEILTYKDGPITLWREDGAFPERERLDQIAEDGVVFVCSNPKNHNYLNVALFAHALTSRVRAVTTSYNDAFVFVPKKALELLENGDFKALERFVNEYAGVFQRKHEGDRKRIDCERVVRGPRHATFMLTMACNYRCVFCLFHGDTFQFSNRNILYKRRMDFYRDRVLQQSDYMKLLDEMKATGIEEITLAGWGEPLLYKGYMSIIKRIKELGMKCEIITNGSMLDADAGKQLIEEGVDNIRVSLNAASAETYAKIHGNIKPEMFERVTSNLRRIVRERDVRELSLPMMGASFVISRWNIHEVFDMLVLAVDTGLDYVSLYPALLDAVDERDNDSFVVDEEDARRIFENIIRFNASDIGSGNMLVNISVETFDYLYHSEEYSIERPCFAGRTTVSISPYGDVFPCCSCTKSMGSICEQPFPEIWFGETYNKMRKMMNDLPQTQKPIAGCDCLRCENVIGRKAAE